MIPVRRIRVLPPPSFRFRLATDTLGFGYDLPTAGRSRDFHPLERALAGRTKQKPPLCQVTVSILKLILKLGGAASGNAFYFL